MDSTHSVTRYVAACMSLHMPAHACTQYTQELQSLGAIYHLGKKSQLHMEVRGQQQLPSAKERNILVQEMEAEFLNRKKITICGLPAESTSEVSGLTPAISCVYHFMIFLTSPPRTSLAFSRNFSVLQLVE